MSMRKFMLLVEDVVDFPGPKKSFPNAHDDFVRGYFEAALFSLEVKTKRPALDSDIDSTSTARMLRDCKEFQGYYGKLLAAAYAKGLTPMQAGENFWFCRWAHNNGYDLEPQVEADRSLWLELKRASDHFPDVELTWVDSHVELKILGFVGEAREPRYPMLHLLERNRRG